MEQVDTKIVAGFRSEVTQQLAESVEFAVNALVNDGEHDRDEHRQAAQEALVELLTPMVENTLDAYRRSPLKDPDYEAVALIYKNLAIRAALLALCARPASAEDELPVITAVTRKGPVRGVLSGVSEHEGMESALIGEQYVPVVSILDLQHA